MHGLDKIWQGGSALRYADKIKNDKNEDVWNEYCGFMHISMKEYMQIQRRLMEEQMNVWCNSGVGKKILQGKKPKTIDEFRKMVPLTTYEDYADILLSKRSDMLPGEPVVWLQTTWEGGKHPVKIAPYTEGMIDVFKNGLLTMD